MGPAIVIPVAGASIQAIIVSTLAAVGITLTALQVQKLANQHRKRKGAGKYWKCKKCDGAVYCKGLCYFCYYKQYGTYEWQED